MRKRSKPHTFAQRLSDERGRIEAQLNQTDGSGPQRDLLVRKLQQIETASQIDKWAASKELQPPK